MHRFLVSKETIALDVVEAVGHAGTFLKHSHTIKNFRGEMLPRDLSKRHWQATLSTSMTKETREIAKQVLREHRVEPLSADVLKKGNALVKEYERQVAR